jgi:hypothetical protein
MTALFLRLAEHEYMEQRFGSLLMIADVAFLRKFEPKPCRRMTIGMSSWPLLWAGVRGE